MTATLLAQLGEHRSTKQEIAGSNPRPDQVSAADVMTSGNHYTF